MSQPDLQNPPELKLFNTLTGKLERFEPLESPKVKLYVCGPTVYDDAHLGHARCYITWDVLFRFLTFLGYEVDYVRNVTDVDDKILARAKERGVRPAELARANYESFAADMAALNVLPPTHEPRATAHISDMIELIQGLIAKNAAYVTPEGTVYFRVSADANYGQLSKKPLDDLKSGARVEVDPHKENPLDFALWKHVSEAERTDAKLAEGYCFESPWGRGRPGWHIECSAMNYALLGPKIDIHAGGADLIFPHHENEIAQTETWQNLPGGTDEAHENERFAKYWLHNGFVNVSGEKMSKSLGNFSTIKKVLERYDANTIRYFLLTNSYRMPVDFNEEALEGAENRIIKISRMLNIALKDLSIPRSKILEYTTNPFGADDPHDPIQWYFKQGFISALINDMNTADALSSLNELINNLRWFTLQKLSDELQSSIEIPLAEESGKEIRYTYNTGFQGYRRIFTHSLSLLAILGFDLNLFFAPIELPTTELQAIQEQIANRKQAKADKNWALADEIRDRILAEGYKLLDNKDGTTSVEKDGVEIVRV